MKLLKCLTVLSLVVALVSCSTPEEKMTKYLTGKWETVFLKLEMPTFQKKDTLVEYDIDFANPDDPRAKDSPITFTIHEKDGTFETWQEKNKMPSGPITKGTWKVVGDSLHYGILQGKKKISIAFGIAKVEDGYSMTGKQDRDRDGEKDDVFYIETIRRPYEKKEE